jgi:hypothetical protein
MALYATAMDIPCILADMEQLSQDMRSAGWWAASSHVHHHHRHANRPAIWQLLRTWHQCKQLMM